MDSYRWVAWGLVSGLVASAIVTFWPASWQYAPGLVFGATLVAYFAKDLFGRGRSPALGWVKALFFVALSILAYHLALTLAEWTLGTNGFANFDAYNSREASSGLYVAVFVGGCIGAFILSIGIETLFFRYNLFRGMFLFTIMSAAVGSIITAGFENLGFYPQFLFPIWHLGMSGVVTYLYRASSAEG